MGNPNARGLKPTVAPKAITPADKKATSVGGQKPPRTGPVKPNRPREIDIAVSVPGESGQGIGQDILAQGVPRAAMMRFSATARNTMKDKPEMGTLVIAAKVYKQALLALVEWMKTNVSESEPSDLELPPGTTATFEKTVMLYSVSQIFGIPRRFTEHLRTRILRYLDAPLACEQVQLVWETMQPDAGIINLFARKLVELRFAGLYNESAQAAIRAYIRTQPRLNDDLAARIKDKKALDE